MDSRSREQRLGSTPCVSGAAAPEVGEVDELGSEISHGDLGVTKTWRIIPVSKYVYHSGVNTFRIIPKRCLLLDIPLW